MIHCKSDQASNLWQQLELASEKYEKLGSAGHFVLKKLHLMKLMKFVLFLILLTCTKSIITNFNYFLPNFTNSYYLLATYHFYQLLNNFYGLLPLFTNFYCLPVILPTFIIILLTFYHLSPILYYFLSIENGSDFFFFFSLSGMHHQSHYLVRCHAADISSLLFFFTCLALLISVTPSCNS